MNEWRLKLVLLAGLIGATVVVLGNWISGTSPANWMFSAIGWVMLVHQCDEHVFSELALGPQRAFLAWVRTLGYELSAGRALLLNVGVGWTLAMVAGCAGERWVVVPLFVMAVESVNAFWHLSLTALERRCVPGTLSSLFITIPFGFALFHLCLARHLISPALCYGLLLAAALSHHAFLSSLPRRREEFALGRTA